MIFQVPLFLRNPNIGFWNRRHPPRLLLREQPHWWQFWRRRWVKAFPGLLWFDNSVVGGFLFLPTGRVIQTSIEEAQAVPVIDWIPLVVKSSHDGRNITKVWPPVVESTQNQNPLEWPKVGWARAYIGYFGIQKWTSLYHLFVDGKTLCGEHDTWVGGLTREEPGAHMCCQGCLLEQLNRGEGLALRMKPKRRGRSQG